MKLRNSNFELLRILSMFMIVAHHYSVHGQFEKVFGVHLNNMILNFLYLGGKIGVVLFVLITGYHMIHSQIKIKKIIRLELQILFYSILISLFFFFFQCNSVGTLTITNLVQSLFPVAYYTYWFATVYMVLYLLIPYINKLLLSLSQKEYIQFLILGLIICTLVPTFFGTNLSADNIIYFIYFYSIGSYIKLYPIQTSSKKLFIFSLASYFLLFLTTVFFEYMTGYDGYYSSYIYYFTSLNNVFVLGISISVFLLFKNIRIKNNRIINIIASSTFGIYLIHDHPYVRNFLWITLFKNHEYYQSSYLWIHSIIVIFTVFVVASLIEIIRKYLIEVPIFSCCDKALTKKKNRPLF